MSDPSPNFGRMNDKGTSRDNSTDITTDITTDTVTQADRPGPVHIDCGDCVMRDIACSDCVVTVLLGPPRAELNAGEQRAIAVLADSGLVPPLRMAR